MEGLAPQVKDLVRADGPAVDVDANTVRLAFRHFRRHVPPGTGVARQLEGVAPRRVFREQRNTQTEVVQY